MKIDVLLIVINLGVFLSLFNMELISSFFPLVASGKGIEKQTIGIIFSMHPIGWLVVSIIAGSVMVRPGFRKRLIMLSFFFALLGMTILLLIDKINNKVVYIILACLARLFTGMVIK